MGQLRNLIRKMVRNEFAARMVAEAKGDKVYRHSNYDVEWSDLETGKAGTEPADKASKHDFVRWFMKVYINPTSSLNLVGNELAQVSNMLKPLASDPDKFIEALNKERGLVFGNADLLSSNPDPAAYVLGLYLMKMGVSKDKKGVVKQGKTASELVSGVEADLERVKPEEKIYDVIDDDDMLTKQAIADLVGMSPMTTGNVLDSAVKHIAVAMRKSEEETKQYLKRLSVIGRSAFNRYVSLFVDSMIDAFKGLKPEDAEGEKAYPAFKRGLGIFEKETGVTVTPVDEEIFKVIVLKNDNEGLKKLIELANAGSGAEGLSEDSEHMYDEVVAIAKEVLLDEVETQTNFDHLGSFLDNVNAIKQFRQQLGTQATRGRPAGTTKAVMAARSAQES